MPLVLVLNGTNLNMLGIREPQLYGTKTLDDVRDLCVESGKQFEFDVDFRQSNHEGDLIDWVHELHDKSSRRRLERWSARANLSRPL